MKSRPLADRFWEKVEKRGPNECWPWKGCVGAGYGQIRLGNKGPRLGAHRVAYSLAHGRLDPDLHVLHSCDFKRCCNPAHLSLGTHANNLREAAERGLTSRGEQRWSAKLTETQALDVLAAYRMGASARELATRMGLPTPLIRRLINGETWKHLPRGAA